MFQLRGTFKNLFASTTTMNLSPFPESAQSFSFYRKSARNPWLSALTGGALLSPLLSNANFYLQILAAFPLCESAQALLFTKWAEILSHSKPRIRVVFVLGETVGNGLITIYGQHAVTMKWFLI